MGVCARVRVYVVFKKSSTVQKIIRKKQTVSHSLRNPAVATATQNIRVNITRVVYFGISGARETINICGLLLRSRFVCEWKIARLKFSSVYSLWVGCFSVCICAYVQNTYMYSVYVCRCVCVS